MDLLAQQMAERRERILAATREIIGRLGHEALTMRDLARASRVTVPTIYNLIGGKEAVLFAAVEDRTAHFVTAVETAAAPSPLARVLAVVDACVDEFLALPFYYRSMLTLIYASPAAGPMRAETGRAVLEPIESALAELAAAGDLVDWADPRTFAHRIGSHVQVTSLQWSIGELDDQRMRAVSAHGTAVLLLGVTRGESHARLESLARDAQMRIHERPRASAGESGSIRRTSP